MADHPCPSCGFIHQSDGNEVAPIIVQNIVRPFEEPAAPPPLVYKSSCPVCLGLGHSDPHFESLDPTHPEFNAHMAAGVHGADVQMVKQFPPAPPAPPAPPPEPEPEPLAAVDPNEQRFARLEASFDRLFEILANSRKESAEAPAAPAPTPPPAPITPPTSPQGENQV